MEDLTALRSLQDLQPAHEAAESESVLTFNNNHSTRSMTRNRRHLPDLPRKTLACRPTMTRAETVPLPAAPQAQWSWVHWMDFMSTPSCTISQSGDISRRRPTCLEQSSIV